MDLFYTEYFVEGTEPTESCECTLSGARSVRYDGLPQVLTARSNTPVLLLRCLW